MAFMVLVSLVEKEEKLRPPIAVAITIAPSQQEAIKNARQELMAYVSQYSNYLFKTKYLGQILFPPLHAIFATTVFLYTQAAGRIK